MPDPAVRAEYDRLAPRYDRRWSRYVERSLAMLRPLVEGRPLGRVLDLGCGTAALAPRLAAWGAPATYAGVDLSAPMLRAAPVRTVAAAAADALPFPAGTFDTVVSTSSLHYWPAPAAALAEVRRVLGPGGRLLLLDWVREGWTMRAMDRVLQFTGAPYHRMYERGELEALLRGAGFHVREVQARKITVIWKLVLLDAVPSSTRE